MAQFLQPTELSELEKYFEQAWKELEPLLGSADDGSSQFHRNRLAQLMISLRSDQQSPEELVAAAKQLFIQQRALGQSALILDTPAEHPQPSI